MTIPHLTAALADRYSLERELGAEFDRIVAKAARRVGEFST